VVTERNSRHLVAVISRQDAEERRLDQPGRGDAGDVADIGAEREIELVDAEDEHLRDGGERDGDGDQQDQFILGELVMTRTDPGGPEQVVATFPGSCAVKTDAGHNIFQIEGEDLTIDVNGDGVHNPDDGDQFLDDNNNGKWDATLEIELWQVEFVANEEVPSVFKRMSTKIYLPNAR